MDFFHYIEAVQAIYSGSYSTEKQNSDNVLLEVRWILRLGSLKVHWNWTSLSPQCYCIPEKTKLNSEAVWGAKSSRKASGEKQSVLSTKLAYNCLLFLKRGPWIYCFFNLSSYSIIKSMIPDYKGLREKLY